MNLTTYLSTVGNTINGKALRPADLNLVTKLDLMGVSVLDTRAHVCRNPVSGYSAVIDPFLAALVNWTFRVYSTYDPMSGSPMSYRGVKVTIQTYDRVRHLVLSLNGGVYSNFLD